MNPGSRVRLKSDPGRVGVTTGRSRERGGRIFWQVTFPDGSQYLSEKQLEVVPDDHEDILDLISQGKFGRALDLRGATTHIRLTGRLADLIYSMEITNTDFYSYQFKPVLKFLESPSNGLLIADEVGLGKTIEAGLIWTELRTRFDARRLMVLCPAMLREKWRAELRLRFGIEAEILDAGELHQGFLDCRSGVKTDYAVVCSLQGLRPNRGWDDEGGGSLGKSGKLARFLSDNENEEPLLDLLIVDEAHYMRNPSSMTAKLGRLLRAVTENVVLLSATPIHLHNQDLFQLLNLVDEDSFNQVHVFDDILQANEPLLRARDAVLAGRLNREEFLDYLREAMSHPLIQGSRQLAKFLENPPTNEDLQDNTLRSRIANRLESVNLLGHAVTRTRKREVTEWRVTREAVPEMIPMTVVEEEFYQKVTELVRKYCMERDAHEGFLLVTPQRQISSSMPAALREWQSRIPDVSEQLYEDFNSENSIAPEAGPLVQELIAHASELGDLDELIENDSKYHRLLEQLSGYLTKHPNDKIILFAYFRPTLNYLHERLTQDGISSMTIMGGGQVNKYEMIEEFKKKSGPSILLASEVASEGIDLQFCRVLINYDLPWNPMKVEQRIGRIDRLGQKSPKITIWNLFYENTIDSRIYQRLYDRLEIFERTLGGLEAVLGEEIKNLTMSLMRGELTPAQEEEQIKQTAQAIATLRAEEEKLEVEAGNLVAHGDYILNQVNAARELGRWITGEDLWQYVRDFFTSRYTGCEFRQINPDELIFDIRLSDEAIFQFDQFVKDKRLTAMTALSTSRYKPIRCHFENRVGSARPGRIEIVSQFHPLVRFVSYMISESVRLLEDVYYPAVSVKINHRDITGVKPGSYAFLVERWSIQGVRSVEKLFFGVKSIQDDAPFLDEEMAEQLVTRAARLGSDWLEAAITVDLNRVTDIVEESLSFSEQEYNNYVTEVENENNDRADVQERSLRLHLERQLEKLNAVIEKHKEKGHTQMIAPTKGRIEKLTARVDYRLKEIDQRRALKHHRKEVSAGVIKVD